MTAFKVGNKYKLRGGAVAQLIRTHNDSKWAFLVMRHDDGHIFTLSPDGRRSVTEPFEEYPDDVVAAV